MGNERYDISVPREYFLCLLSQCPFYIFSALLHFVTSCLSAFSNFSIYFFSFQLCIACPYHFCYTVNVVLRHSFRRIVILTQEEIYDQISCK